MPLLRPLRPLLYPFYKRYKNYTYRNFKKNFSENAIVEKLFHWKRFGTMIDVGAHYGESFALFEKLGWDVYAFEPDPSNRAKIEVQTKYVRLSDLAVSNEAGLELEFYTSEESTGISGLVAFHDTHTSKYKVRTTTLTELVEQEHLKKIDFLKIDTEGNDLLVLKGHPFEKIKPKVIICEFEDKKTQHLSYTYEDMGDFLLSNGYIVYISEWRPIKQYGTRHEWHSITLYEKGSKLNNALGWGNFVAVVPEMAQKFDKVLKKYMKTIEK